MGVTGLWSIVQPCARPTKIETLNRKRLAVDASIWIYQFLKAVRDKEGNALRNSHVVGFFRRICKLLFFGIKPIFVFDGGAPALKRSVIQQRKRRREGRRDDAVRTAGKLLAVQMQRRAEEDEMKRKEASTHSRVQAEEEVPDEGLVYVDELFSTPQERKQNQTRFRKKDAYHLPELDVAMHEMGGPNDPRVMSLEELQSYARQFDSGEDVNVYDFSKIDYDSPFFTSLPASDRYNILNAARLRSRLRMGHSKEQLDTMFPDRMAFSKFQIERVTERNELTQRLMHVHEGGEGAFDGMGRVAGEKGREYVLVKNDGVEGGWALGVVSNEGRTVNNAIDLDEPAPIAKVESDSDEEADFEDVAIEGLNRLPKRQAPSDHAPNDLNRQRQAFYRNRKKAAKRARSRRVPKEDQDSLFVAEEEQVQASDDIYEERSEIGSDQEDENAELERAIALSLQQEHQEDNGEVQASDESADEGDDDMLEVFQQSAVADALPVPRGSGRAIANTVNKRAYNAAPESHEITSFGVPVPKPDDTEDEADNAMDLQAALAESRRTKRKKTPPGPKFLNVQPRTPATPQKETSIAPSNLNLQKEKSATDIAKAHGFSGPLPFEKLDLGSSLLGKKKMEERQQQAAGGFDNSLAEQKKAGPLPPWFSGNLEKDLAKQREVEDEDRERARAFNKRFQFDNASAPLQRRDTNDVIDLEAEDEQEPSRQRQIIDLDDDDALNERIKRANDSQAATAEQDFNSVAEDVRAGPPTPGLPDEKQPKEHGESQSWEDTSARKGLHLTVTDQIQSTAAAEPDRVETDLSLQTTKQKDGAQAVGKDEDGQEDKDEDGQEEHLDWSESEDGRQIASTTNEMRPSRGESDQARSRSSSANFEDVAIPDKPSSLARKAQVEKPAADQIIPPLDHQENLPADEFLDDFSDPEDEELMRSLAQEAEEHARFESSLNQKSVAQNIADYERELKQLRNQQKKDRRDADEVTHIMITECQQLLRLFGLPFITAPMEAEAQCAELVKLGLVDGIVTDDSDCFLFGGTRVYKNVFNQAKFVECYLSSDLEKEFDLTREKMIAAAQLLGSDYTEGLTGVGPVTALEIIAEFGDLQDFKKWWTGVQDLSIPKEDDSNNTFRKKFRKNAKKLFLPPAFPDERVNIAYLEPEVDSSDQPFMWGVPDLDALRTFLMSTIGWSQERTDEVLVPVIKDMNRRMDEGTQANITAFFEGGVGAGAAGRGQGGEAFAPRRRIDTSKRMGRAMGRLASQARRDTGRTTNADASPAPDGSTQSEGTVNSQPTNKSATSRKKRAAVSETVNESAGEDPADEASTVKAAGPKRRRKA